MVCDVRSHAPGILYAAERGIPTSSLVEEVYSIPGLELVIELTGSDAVVEEIVADYLPGWDWRRQGETLRFSMQPAIPSPDAERMLEIAKALQRLVPDEAAAIGATEVQPVEGTAAGDAAAAGFAAYFIDLDSHLQDAIIDRTAQCM